MESPPGAPTGTCKSGWAYHVWNRSWNCGRLLVVKRINS